jgi:tRNA-modifying protein YgfZ
MTKIELTGRDRTKFLHNLCTQDIKGLEPGHGCEAFLTNAQGRILYFVRAFADAESLWLDTVPGVAKTLLAHLDHFRISERVEMTDRSSQFAQVLFMGPKARDCLVAAGASAPASGDLAHANVVLAGQNCALIHIATLVQPAYELRIPAAYVADIWQAMWRAAMPLGLLPMGTSAFDSLRVEAGWPEYGRDIDETNLPQELGRTERAVSFTKGCYLGQETVARIDALGHVNKHLVGLMIPSERDLPPSGAQIILGDKVLGQVTSSAYSVPLGHAIAMGYVRRGHERPGTELVIESRNKAVRAVVYALPFRK